MWRSGTCLLHKRSLTSVSAPPSHFTAIARALVAIDAALSARLPSDGGSSGRQQQQPEQRRGRSRCRRPRLGRPGVVSVRRRRTPRHARWGLVHDSVWGRHLLQRLREVADEASDDAHDVAFSFGRRQDPFDASVIRRVSSTTNPGAGADAGFHFEDEGVAQGDPDSGRRGRLGFGQLFFMVHSANPRGRVVSSHAPRISEDTIAIATLDIEEFSKSTRNVYVHLERAGGVADRDLDLITPSVAHPTMLDSCFMWQISSTVTYSFSG